MHHRGVPLVHVGGEKFENDVHGSFGARHVAFLFRTRRDHEAPLATCVESRPVRHLADFVLLAEAHDGHFGVPTNVIEVDNRAGGGPLARPEDPLTQS